MAHEMFHHWNPMSMGPRSGTDVAQWFAEGFTVYYAGVIPLRSGLTSYSDYLDYLNRWLRRYELSALRRMKEADWKAISHASGPGGELSYERGAAIALWADAEIRTRSGGRSSLDNVMLDLVKQAQAATPPPDFMEERVMGAFAPYLSPTDMARLRSIAVDGADVPLPEKLGRCAERRKETRRVVDPGLNEQTSFQQKRVTGVVQGGAAYQAGLRDGQVLFRWSIYHEDPSKDALLGVVVNGEKKVIHFSPAKQQEVEQYHATGEGDAAKACTPF